MELEEAINQQLGFFLVGCDTAKERDAMSEFWHVLIKYCKATPIEVFELENIRGLFLMAVKELPKELLPILENTITKNRYEFLYCRKFTPLEEVFESTLENIVKRTAPLMKKVPKKKSWRVSVNRRHTSIKRREVIISVTSLPSVPKGRVDLTNPQWEIIIEIFGKWTGIGVYPYDSVLSTATEP